MWAPALYTFLAISWGKEGWLVIAAIVVVSAAGLHWSAGVAQRFLDTHGPPPEEVESDPLAEEAPPVGPPSILEDPPLSPVNDGSGPPTMTHQRM